MDCFGAFSNQFWPLKLSSVQSSDRIAHSASFYNFLDSVCVGIYVVKTEKREGRVRSTYYAVFIAILSLNVDESGVRNSKKNHPLSVFRFKEPL